MRRLRVTRPEVLRVLAALVVVAVSVLGYRLSDTSGHEEVVTARLDRPTRFDSGHLVLSDVRVGDRLSGRETAQTSPGVFVVVQVLLRADGGDSVTVGNLQLRANQRTYLPFDDAEFLEAPVGFETSRDVVFEVDPADLSDLRVECFDRGIVYRYYRVVQVPLGIAADVNRDAEVTATTTPESRAVS